jgi:hypothetical protein
VTAWTGNKGRRENEMAMERSNIAIGKCYRDSFGVVYRVAGYDGNSVRYILHDDRVERLHWGDFLADLQGEIDCPQ